MEFKHLSTYPQMLSYDFTVLAESLRAYFPIFQSGSQEAFKRQVMQFSDLERFMPVYLEEAGRGNTDILLRRYRPPARQSILGLKIGSMKFAGELGYERFSNDQDDFSGGVTRSRHIYPLRQAEYEDGRKYIMENPEFHVGMAMFQDCLGHYLYGLFGHTMAYLDEPVGVRDMKIIQKIMNNAYGASFLHDLSPYLAYSFSRNSDPKTIDEEDMRKGLRILFQRSAFKSTGFEHGFNRCPFSRAFARVSRVHIEPDMHGGYFAENGKLGETIQFFMQHAMRLYTREEINLRVLENLAHTPGYLDFSHKSF